MTLAAPTPVVRAVLYDDTGSFVYCQFNPQTMQRVKSANWTHAPTRGAHTQPKPQFVGTGTESLSATLLFDLQSVLGAPATHTPAMSIDQLLKWLTVPPAAQTKATPQPPTVTFQWGTGISFKGILRQVTVSYTKFAPSGDPIRATAAINMQALPDDPLGTNPSSGGISGRTSAQVHEGDTLASIAYKKYGDPNLWRAIAIANNIEDPSRVPVGTNLMVPPRAEATSLSSPRHDVGEDGGSNA
jgi:hypothetical protein